MIGRLILMGCLALITTTAQAHLLPKGNATIRIAKNSAFLVVSVPARALSDVDDDANGIISSVEIDRHKDAIEEQFRTGFALTDGANVETRSLTWITVPHTDGHANSVDGMDYVVVMHRVDFATVPQQPKMAFRLFGSGAQHERLTVKASRGKTTEIAELNAEYPEHSFFVTG